MRLVWHNHSGWLLSIVVRNDADVADQWTRLVLRLESLECDVLTALQLDEVLDSVDDGERAVSL